MMSQIVSASSLFFTPFNPEVYSNQFVFSITPQVPKIQFIPQFNVNPLGFIEISKRPPIVNQISKTTFVESQKSPPQIIKETPLTIKTISITKEGFTPQTLYIHQGEKVQWINKRTSPGSLVHGVRSLSEMRSPMLEQDQIFTWNFDTKGTFVYVDSVVIGRIGKIIVR
ncbi:hypothetical protein HOD05_02455 [Candidatus Woesearchaeota archaeon]|nr:hypothetical protein [Candidatus Woesearchaeota archaeon]MBT4434058.1 hypothetical protein [Candidatus Woesearchaeota archaeon]